MNEQLTEKLIDRPLSRLVDWLTDHQRADSGLGYRLAAVLLALRFIGDGWRDTAFFVINTPRWLLGDFLEWLGLARRIRK